MLPLHDTYLVFKLGQVEWAKSLRKVAVSSISDTAWWTIVFSPNCRSDGGSKLPGRQADFNIVGNPFAPLLQRQFPI